MEHWRSRDQWFVEWSLPCRFRDNCLEDRSPKYSLKSIFATRQDCNFHFNWAVSSTWYQTDSHIPATFSVSKRDDFIEAVTIIIKNEKVWEEQS